MDNRMIFSICFSLVGVAILLAGLLSSTDFVAARPFRIAGSVLVTLAIFIAPHWRNSNEK